jgi:pyruvate/2-oxoglutarate dehydrogenase complex dihydrolipoamide dehydrogenase (E3) component
VPQIPGLPEAGYLDNTTIWSLSELPKSLVIIGGGPVGLEFGQALRRLGAEVTILESNPRILAREDAESAEALRTALEAEGIRIFTGAEVAGVALRDGRKVVKFRLLAGDKSSEAACDEILVAAGRLANVESLNLGAIGIEADAVHGIHVDDYLLTHAPNVWAIGDVVGLDDFTHAADRMAAVAFQNAVLHLSKKYDRAPIPRACFTDPELASVGPTESAALATDPSARVFRAEIADVDRARIDGVTAGLAKVVTTAGGKVLGASIVARDAGLIIPQFTIAVERGLNLTDLADVVQVYPTLSGVVRRLANQFAATRREKGVVRTALRWFLGLDPAKPATKEEEAPEEPSHAGH